MKGVGLRFEKGRRAGRIDHEIVWGSIGLVALAAARFLGPGALGPTLCPLREVACIPCIACGATRSFAAFARGDPAGAFAMNPAAALLFGFLLAYVPYAAAVVLLRLPRARLVLAGGRGVTAARVSAAAALLVNWVYLIAVGR